MKHAATLVILTAAVAWGAAGPEPMPAYLAGVTFGAGSYESFHRAGTGLERAYKVGFAFGGQFYHGGGRVDHVFSFRYRAGTAFNQVDKEGD